jgi:hypothetical protein
LQHSPGVPGTLKCNTQVFPFLQICFACSNAYCSCAYSQLTTNHWPTSGTIPLLKAMLSSYNESFWTQHKAVAYGMWVCSTARFFLATSRGLRCLNYLENCSCDLFQSGKLKVVKSLHFNAL